MTIEERFEFLFQSIESHDRILGELSANLSRTESNINKLVEVTNQDALAIRTLARIIDIHEQRLSNLEQQ